MYKKRLVEIILLLTFFLPGFSFASTALTAQVISLSQNTVADDSLARAFNITLDRQAAINLSCVESAPGGEHHLLHQFAARKHTLLLRGLKSDTEYQCKATTDSGKKIRSNLVTFTTQPLPANLPKPEIVVDSQKQSNTGYTLYNYAVRNANGSMRDRYLVIIDAEGEVRWYLQDAGGINVEAVYLGDEKIAYGGWVHRDEYITPTIIGLNKQIAFVATTETASETEIPNSFHHDVDVSENAKSIFTVMHTRVDNIWSGFLIKEIDLATNRVVWSWDSLRDGVEAGYLQPGSETNPDPYHANAVFDREENGKLQIYVSARNQQQILKIDYQSKALVWSLGVNGDFTLLEKDGNLADSSRWFFGQHDVQRHGNILSVYDNGLDRVDYGGEAYSRAVQLELDESARTARIIFEYDDQPNWGEPNWGGFDPLPNGHSLLAIGHNWIANPRPYSSRLLELNKQQKVVWEARFVDKTAGIYRADRIDGCAIFNNLSYCPQLKHLQH